jgi:protein-tyrosine-phosphatase
MYGISEDTILFSAFFKTTVDWGLEDPKGKPIEKVREIRDEIERRVKTLIEQDV